MKTFFTRNWQRTLFFCAVVSSSLSPASAGHAADTLRLSEPVAKDEVSETFGALLNPALESVSLGELINNGAQHLGKPFQLETKIAKVCQKKGCFFIAQQNEHVIRVSFKDYGFFIPTNTSGNTVIINGELIQKHMSEEQAAHFTADLSEHSSAIKPGSVLEIVATSVNIRL